jgi:F0F1-type ATP synthase assembly protein I
MNLPDSGSRKRPGEVLRETSMAWELPFVLVGPVLIGGGLGYLLDEWFHTAPVLMLVVGLLGFAGGIWDMLRRVSQSRQNHGR